MDSIPCSQGSEFWTEPQVTSISLKQTYNQLICKVPLSLLNSCLRFMNSPYSSQRGWGLGVCFGMLLDLQQALFLFVDFHMAGVCLLFNIDSNQYFKASKHSFNTLNLEMICCFTKAK